MCIRKVWEVDINIIGPLSISNAISFKQEKGFSDKFYSDIRLKNSHTGIFTTVTAYAENSYIAKTVAFVFLGRMVDILSLDNDIPLILSEHDRITSFPFQSTTRRALEKEDFIMAFNVARKLEKEQPILLKAIGWYSKGKTSNNVLDRFLAYWNAIEIISARYHKDTERTCKGIKNMAYQCFLDYFGEVDSWELPCNWIDDMYEKRNRIAHGAEETSAEAINAVTELIPTIESTSRKLIYSVLDHYYKQNIFEEEYMRVIF